MPKIIENVRGMLLEEAQKQINENGYENVTIRSIAKGCGLGLGTFYNYFKSKEMLIATFLLEDWKGRMKNIREKNENESDPMVVIRDLHNEIGNFINTHQNIFSSPTAIKSFKTTDEKYHRFLRSQVADPIYNTCVALNYENAEFLSLFVAEAVVTWTVAGKNFDEIAEIISKLFVK